MFFPPRLMALLEFLCHLLDAQTFGGEEHFKVEEHVGCFVEQAVVGSVRGFDYGFKRLFAHLLCHAVEPISEEGGRVRTFGHVAVALFYDVLEFREEKEGIDLILFTPTRVRSCVAGGTVGDNLHEEGVVVAIFGDADKFKVVAALFTFSPKALARTTEECDAPRFERLIVRFLVHIAKHEHVACRAVLDNCGNESALFFEIDHRKMRKKIFMQCSFENTNLTNFTNPAEYFC